MLLQSRGADRLVNRSAQVRPVPGLPGASGLRLAEAALSAARRSKQIWVHKIDHLATYTTLSGDS